MNYIKSDPKIAAIVATAPRFQQRPPPPVVALRVTKIEGPFNPSHSSYESDKHWLVTFEDGSTIAMLNDYVSGFCGRGEVGGYYAFNLENGGPHYYSEEAFRAEFAPVTQSA